ncbi:hypothetical protein D3C74_456880 [compost metagenome]
MVSTTYCFTLISSPPRHFEFQHSAPTRYRKAPEYPASFFQSPDADTFEWLEKLTRWAVDPIELIDLLVHSAFGTHFE